MTDPIGWAALGAAAAAWVGVVTGSRGLAVPALVVVAVVVVVRRASWVWVLGAVMATGAVVGWSQARADRALTERLAGVAGPVAVEGVLATDGFARPAPGRGWYARLDPAALDGRPWPGGPPLLLSVPDGEPPPMGTEVAVAGELAPGLVTIRGRPVAGVLSGRRVDVLAAPSGLAGVAESIRERVRSVVLAAPPPGGPLLAGFLLGDTSQVDPVVVEDLRRVGLSHFVAVSGSNVALFLVGWWVVTLPLAIRPRLRWATGIAGLVLFATVTRWEPSVVRASVMAGLALATRRAGLVLSGKGLLGVAVAGTLLVEPRFASDLGFGLSVAATAGLLVGARRGPSPIGRAWRATVAAQVAVAPILLAVVGEVPLVGPVANLAAAPLVSASTVVGAVASVVGSPALAGVAAWGADAVVAIARVGAPFPTLGWIGLATVVAVAALWRRAALRPYLAGGGAVALGVALVVGGGGPGPGPWVVFLDVGQGDAAIVRGATGETILVDGGPDPVVLAAALDRYSVDHVDLLVVSHRHADHVTGLSAVVGRMPVGEVWYPDHPDLGALGGFLDAAGAAGIPTRSPRAGTVARLGSLRIEVLGPMRRYASPNDQSLVVLVEVGGVDVLFSGDIETFAQADIGPVAVDVLKVPHQGGATSDLDWIAASAGDLSVVSVGPNDYGHPSDEVLRALRRAGATVCRTDRHGDVLVRPRGAVDCPPGPP